MNDEASRFRQRIACISDSSRFEIVLLLSAGDLCVSAVARRIGRSQSCTTRHLQALQRLGLVRGRRDGKQVLFEVCATEPEIRMVLEAAGAGVSAGAPSWLGTDVGARPNGPVPLVSRSRRTKSRGDGRVLRRPHQIAEPKAADDGPTADEVQPAAVVSDREWSDDAERSAPAPIPIRQDLEDYLL